MIAVILQYHDGDRVRAEELARFIADIEPVARPDVKMRFWARYDAEHLGMETFRYVGRKFDVTWGHSRRKWQGWPAGPNGMVYDIIEDGMGAMLDVGWRDVTGLLLIEPDCVPLSRDWLTQLSGAWDKALADDKWIMGSWRNSGPECGHINGNCIIRPDLRKKVDIRKAPQELAWDCFAAPYLKNSWEITGLIRNDFSSNDATVEKLRTPEVGFALPVLVHGYKDTSAFDIAKRWLL